MAAEKLESLCWDDFQVPGQYLVQGLPWLLEKWNYCALCSKKITWQSLTWQHFLSWFKKRNGKHFFKLNAREYSTWQGWVWREVDWHSTYSNYYYYGILQHVNDFIVPPKKTRMSLLSTCCWLWLSSEDTDPLTHETSNHWPQSLHILCQGLQKCQYTSLPLACVISKYRKTNF